MPFFIALTLLLKWKPKTPWIILISIIGIIYGAIMKNLVENNAEFAPKILKDIYPEMS